MITRIAVTSKVFDTRASTQKKRLNSLGLSSSIHNLSVIDIYTIEKNLTKAQLEKIASSLANPVFQDYQILSKGSSHKTPLPFSYAIETGYLPGVTDNIATTTREIIEDLLKVRFSAEEGVYSSQLLLINGALGKKDVEAIASALINPLIQRIHIKSNAEYKKDQGMDFIVPRVHLTKTSVQEVNLSVSDEELTTIGKQGIQGKDGRRRGPLALDLSYMKTIQDYFARKKRNPTDIELESIAQTWSEHCKHTIFADPIDDIKSGLFKTYIKAATEKIRKQRSVSGRDICVSVFTDNSGAIEFDSEYLVTHKVETHNTPSALDPFGGAITGIVGVNRDALGFGLGAKPVINTYGYCFAEPTEKRVLYRDKELKQPMLSPRRILEGVVAGVNSGGNCSGIPSPQGFAYFDDLYQGKPLVFVGTVGLIPKKINGRKSYVKQAKPGDYIVMIGGRVGVDGIHGATFSSEALDSGSPSTAVQIGDPITQKKLSDALVKEARDQGLYSSITDNGAGGLSCSVAEMAKEPNGCVVTLEKVPVKYAGLEPWQTWISESQERMTLAVPKTKWKKFNDLMKRRGVEATVIGEFTNSGKCFVNYNGKTIMNIDLEFLHNGLPTRPMKTKKPEASFIEPKVSIKDHNNTLLKLLARPSLASYEFISQQYDHIVQGTAALYPLQGRGRVNSDASIMRPVLASQKGVVLSQALYPSYSQIDSYHMAASSIDTAVRNIIVAGADPDKIALLDNFCWCSSNDPERLYQLKEAAKACYDCAVSYKMPFISGKDSMFNDFKGFEKSGKAVKISVPPTLLISSIGIMDDITKAVSLDAKLPGDLVYLLGKTNAELGGSEFYRMLGETGASIPHVAMKNNLILYKTYHQALLKGLIASAVSVNRGGLAYSLLRTAIGGMLGLSVDFKKLSPKGKLTDYEALFSESAGRILVTVNPKNQKKFEQAMKGMQLSLLGTVVNNNAITIKGRTTKPIVQMSVQEANDAYRKTFKDY